MIPDYEKNTVAIAGNLLREYGTVVADLEQVFDKNSITVEQLLRCRDIWCRDFMPIQVSSREFVQFIYAPSYLHSAKDHPSITIPGLAYPGCLTQKNVYVAPIVLDGGSVVGNHDIAIISEQVIEDNRGWKINNLRHELCKALKVKRVIWVPVNPDDFTGHVDGTVRIVSDRCAVVASPCSNAPDRLKRHADDVIERIEKAGLSVQLIPDVSSRNIGKRDDASGCFANFVQLGTFAVMPTFSIYKAEELEAATALANAGLRYAGVECCKVAEKGGALNCVTWSYMA